MFIHMEKFKLIIFHSIFTYQQTSIISLSMENKYRSFPPAVPLKMNKLLEFQYLYEIYRKYDSNFFREILPYFSQILVTNKLQPLKFVYFPIKNPHKVKNIQIGIPFKPQTDLKNQAIHQINHQVTFIKIALQTHLIFEYLMNLSFSCIPLQRLNFQDKFWLFSEGVLNNFCFSDIVFRKDSRREKGILIFLEGEFVCLNDQKKPFKRIGKGYLIDMNGNLKKAKYDDKMKTDRISFDESILVSANRDSQVDTVIQQEQKQKVSTIWSHSNSAKILFISQRVIKKYCQNFQDPTSKSPVKKQPQGKVKVNQPLKHFFRTQSQLMLKNRRLKTEFEELPVCNNGGKTFTHQQDSSAPQKKFNLISCRGKPPLAPIDPIEELFEHDIIKSYTKEKKLHQIMMRQLSIRRHTKFHSSGDQKIHPIDRKEQLMPFYKQVLKDQKDKVILRRRKTKELWGHSSVDKQNFVVNVHKLAEEVGKEKFMNNNLLKSGKLKKKVSKTELSAFQLLKRNLFNKQYHRADFFQINS